LTHQWVSLDVLSGGRTVFVACQGQPEPGGGAFEKEFAHFGIEPSSRMRRMEEAIEILRLTSSREDVDYDGQYWRFRNLTVLPRPIQQPIPIWVTANPDLNKRWNVEQSYRRVARLGDGWMITFKSPEDVQTSLAMIRGYSREMGHELKPDFEVAIYHNININEDRDGAFAESKRFLDSYYSVDYRQDTLRLWVAARFAHAMRPKPTKICRRRSDDDPAAGHRIRPEMPVQARDGGDTAGVRLRGLPTFCGSTGPTCGLHYCLY
jgi:alkanesulfonate monooxygenase SsuD/methylene tetrahydromethanopterin reductase-like flavin-dependent oxidoreductase (luciferase family)